MVDRALEVSGLRPDASIALVETARPRRNAYSSVLCQNAWNFVPRRQFRELLAPYPLQSQVLYRARRVIAQVNVRRAERVVALSEYMGELVRSHVGDKTLVRQADLTPELLDGTPRRPDWLPAGTRFVLVPGTITWYKRPHLALDLIDDPTTAVVFAGGDDGSGCLQDLQRLAEASGRAHHVAMTTHAETLWLFENASVTYVLGQLESLSLSLAEALVLSRHVVASDIPVHREIAQRLGRQPEWVSGSGRRSSKPLTLEPALGVERVAGRPSLWRDVAEGLSGR